jgi:hypothetical protein
MKIQKGRWAILAVAFAAAGCKSSSGNLSVSASAVNPRATADGGTVAPDGGASTSLDLGNGIVVDRVRIAVRKVKLEGSPAAADGGTAPDAGTDMDPGMAGLSAARTGRDDHGGGGGEGEGGDDEAEPGEVSVGPFLVDLSGTQLASGISQVFDGQVPAGTYREIAIVIGPVSASDGSVPAGFTELAGQSVVVDGTLDGAAFSFAAAIVAKQKREGQVVVSADGTSKNVTLSIDPTGWFKAADGTRLDPSAAANAAAIAANIKASVRVLDDDDHDGQDDQGEHGDGQHGDGHH